MRYTQCAPVGNNAIKSFCHCLHVAHNHSKNFEKAKMCKTKCNFEKFQNTLNMMYTVCAMSEIMIYTLFVIVSTVRITAVQISKNLKCAKQTVIPKIFNTP